MRLKYVVLILMLLCPLLAGLVGAVPSTEITYPRDQVYHYDTFTNTVTWDVTGWDEDDPEYPDEPYMEAVFIMTQIGETFDLSITEVQPDSLGLRGVWVDGDGSYSATFSDETFPFDHKQYFVGLYYSGEYNFFNMSSQSHIQNHFSFRDFSPEHLDLFALDEIRDGIDWWVTSNTTASRPLHLHIVDNENDPTAENNVIAYGQADVTWGLDDWNMSWTYHNTKDSSVKEYDSYTLYVGYDIAYLSGSDLTDYQVTADQTCVPVVFSHDSDDTYKLFEDSVHDRVYTGVKIYFETQLRTGEGGDGIPFSEQGKGTLGGMVRAYGEDIGLPWLHLFIAVIICIIIVCIPLRFAIEYQKDLPNLIYGIALVVAMSINWGIGMIDLWMYAFFLLIIVLVVYMKYKDVILSGKEFIQPQFGSALGESLAVEQDWSKKAKVKLSGLATARAVRHAELREAHAKRIPVHMGGKAGEPLKLGISKRLSQSKPAGRIMAHRISRRARKPFIGLSRYPKKSKPSGKRMPWVAYQGSKKKDRAIAKARETAKRRSS